MNQIAIEDIATVFASEFVKENQYLLERTPLNPRSKFMRMNYARRRKVIEKVIDKLERDARRINSSKELS